VEILKKREGKCEEATERKGEDEKGRWGEDGANEKMKE